MEQMWLDEKGKSDKESEGATENKAKLRQVYREMKMDWRQKKDFEETVLLAWKCDTLKEKFTSNHIICDKFLCCIVEKIRKYLKKKFFIQWHVTKVTTGW